MSTERSRVSAQRLWVAVALTILGGLLIATFAAPESYSGADPTRKELGPLAAPPFGTDDGGRSLVEYALQGAAIVTLPAVLSGSVVALLAILAGLSRCAAIGWTDSALQAFTELVGALPRMVVVMVVAMLVPRESVSLFPIGLTWALLAAPGAMDEAAATAERLGGARFVEALRAHGFSAWRIYVVHIVGYNLRSVIVRQAAEVAMQVVFLEIALSYLGRRDNVSFTHSASTLSWADLLYLGYSGLLGQPMMHAMWLGLGLVALVALMSQAVRLAARAR